MTSSNLFERAQKVMPGGVNSPVRAFNSVGGEPVFIKSAKGAFLYDKDGNEYIDYMMSWGPLIAGHARAEIIDAVKQACNNGLSFGACHEAEAELAELIITAMPHIEKLRMVSSGTEATMSALRLARAATGKNKVIKFNGCYHGHADSFLINAGSGALTHGTPSSPGVTPGAAADTLSAEYNKLETVEKLFTENPNEIACIIVEPVAGNMGLVLPEEGFLQGLRDLCDANSALLIFDEVITGFRVGFGGAAKIFKVTPDLTTLGKIIGGGMPAGAYGGRKELMEMISPCGAVYQAGTLSGNPVACAAGIATLKYLRDRKPYEELDNRCLLLCAGLSENLANTPLKWCINRLGSAFTIFFGIEKATTFSEVSKVDTALYAKYFNAMLGQKVYLPPAQFEANFISTSHKPEVIVDTIHRQKKALNTII